ncbi:hypothetical protein CHARACLAT_017022 [Characodon lateralis]|uniref:Uncharacterized protein n=1 Tax=Characodon lateralis TaxID=208331 RepID=A0ABU7DVB4_9TELE|nr:hypothetical protein [Characodon lateralis]
MLTFVIGCAVSRGGRGALKTLRLPSVLPLGVKQRTAAATEQEEQILKFEAAAVRTERALIPAGLQNQSHLLQIHQGRRGGRLP